MRLTDAALGDSTDVFTWRNDPATRAASVTQDEVSRADHDRWYAAMLTNDARIVYIAHLAGSAIGLCRFDVDGDSAEVGINLNPEFRGRGLARPILAGSIARFRQTHPQVRLTATIRPENVASARTFLAEGFQLTGSQPGFDNYDLAAE